MERGYGRGFSEGNYQRRKASRAQQQQQNTEPDVMVLIREDYKYQVIIGRDCEKVYHSDPLSVLPGEVVTVRNICPAHQDCGFILVNNQFSESGYVQKRMLQSYGQEDTSVCFFCNETFACPQGFEEHLCLEHYYEEHLRKDKETINPVTQFMKKCNPPPFWAIWVQKCQKLSRWPRKPDEAIFPHNLRC